MSLKDRLMTDLKQAMKDKDSIKKDIVQMVRAGVLQIEKDQKIEADDAVVTQVISKEIKKLSDVIPDFEKGGRDDLIAEANKKIEILKAYLPEQLSAEEIADIVKAAIAETGAASPKDMGKVMGAVTGKTKGRADNKLVSQLVKEALQSL
jgi:hypothetical protein